MKIFITGCDGFIGSHVCEELLSHGHEVMGIDNHSKYKFPNLQHHKHQNFHFHLLDLLNESISDLLGSFQPSMVIHCAAVIGGIHLFHAKQYDIISQNATMDANVVDASIKHKINRFIGLSSSMVFENAITFPSKEEDVRKIPPPSSTYGFSKLSLEYMVRGAHEQYGLPYTIIRPFNSVGPFENDFLENKNAHVLPDLIMKCLSGQDPLHILGSGSQVRCYTSAKDIARGIRMAVESDKAVNEDFNISTPVATTVLELAKMVWEKLKDTPFSYVSDTPYEYDVKMRVPCVAKAKNVLGFTADITLEQSVDEVIEYMKTLINS
jgi:UDP-glucose 4-epimerase